MSGRIGRDSYAADRRTASGSPRGLSSGMRAAHGHASPSLRSGGRNATRAELDPTVPLRSKRFTVTPSWRIHTAFGTERVSGHPDEPTIPHSSRLRKRSKERRHLVGEDGRVCGARLALDALAVADAIAAIAAIAAASVTRLVVRDWTKRIDAHVMCVSFSRHERPRLPRLRRGGHNARLRGGSPAPWMRASCVREEAMRTGVRPGLRSGGRKFDARGTRPDCADRSCGRFTVTPSWRIHTAFGPVRVSGTSGRAECSEF